MMSADKPTPPAATDGQTAEQWRTCLHEAGHAVAGWVLLGDTARAVVFDDGCGAAYIGGEAGVDSFERVLIAAAGPAAESLAEQQAPPATALTGARGRLPRMSPPRGRNSATR